MAVYLGSNQIDMFGGNGIVQPTLQTKTINPSESIQNITADNGYDGLDEVIIQGIPLDYVGSGIDQRDSTDLTINGATITIPSGHYASTVTKTVSSGSAGTPIASKGSVSNHAINVTPSVTNTTGYIVGSTKTGTAVSVTASELVSGNLAITSNGTGINVTNYATVSVNINPTIKTATNVTTYGTYTSLNFNVDAAPKAFFMRYNGYIGGESTYRYIINIIYNGSTTYGNWYYSVEPYVTTDTTHYSFSYSNGVLTVRTSSSVNSDGGGFRYGTWELMYIC